MKLQIKRLTETAILPVKAHATDSGFDLFADEDVIIEPGETAVIKTGIAIALPPNHEAQIRPKSGVTSKTDLRVQLGTVDEAYRGEIGIIVDTTARYVDYSALGQPLSPYQMGLNGQLIKGPQVMSTAHTKSVEATKSLKWSLHQ